MIRPLILSISLILWAVPGTAEVTPRLQNLFGLISLSSTIEVMRKEGQDYGQSLRDEMFPGSGGASWDAEIDKIYNLKWMTAIVQDGMAKSLEGADIDPIIAFFQTDLGKRIIKLELSARRTLFDKDLEAASKQRFKDMARKHDPRVALLERFVRANDLIEENVAGAMTSNLAFYKGLRDGKAKGFDLSEDQMLEDIWGQEDQIRADTTDWINGYVTLAYMPLKDRELRAYIEFSKTRAGRDLNQALFHGFDLMFVKISNRLGLAAARYMSGEDI